MGILDELKKNDLLSKIRKTYAPSPSVEVMANDVPASAQQPTPTQPIDTTPKAPGFRVLAVAGPLWPIDQDIAFANDVSQSERRSIVEDFEWCDRVAAREKKKRETENSMGG